MKYPINSSNLRPKVPQVAQTIPFPAPMRGINALSNLAGMQPDDAIFAYNMISGQYGLRTRDGYREWCTNVGTGGVRTIIPYTGSVGAENAMFACGEDAIYDVSASTDTPTSMISFAVTDATSGYGVWHATSNSAGAKFICYTDETNGYYVYTESSGTWAKIAMGAGATEISGVDPATFCFVMSWKNRLWFIQKNTGSAWYLPVGALFGAATKFEFGNKFKYGGSLKGLFNWTLDGGNGVDDFLVGVSSGGDVVVYQGTDPASASTIDQKGTYFIGPPPAGRRIGGSFGGELLLLSSYGLIPMSKLLAGEDIRELATFVTARVTPMINAQMALSRSQLGWEVKFVPTQNYMMIASPKQTSQSYIQFIQSTDTKGWTVYRDMPVETGDVWEGSFYFGDTDNRILVHTGDIDNVLLDDEDSGDAIEWSLLTMFGDLGTPGANKVVQLIRPSFIGEAIPSYNVAAVYDYNIVETVISADAQSPSGYLWDVGQWDVALWGGETITSNTLFGAAGVGRSVAIALRGNSVAKTTLIKFDVSFTWGNVL